MEISKIGTIIDSQADKLSPGDHIVTPTGQTVKVHQIRPHEFSGQHVYVDTDRGTLLAKRNRTYQVSSHNNRQQEVPNVGVPGANVNSQPWERTIPGTAPKKCSVCGYDTLQRHGNTFSCPRCGYRHSSGGPDNSELTDATTRNFSSAASYQPAVVRRAQAEGNRIMQTRADLLTAIAKASTQSEQLRLVEALNELDRIQAEARAEDSSIDLLATNIREAFTPRPTFTHHTAASDWMAETPSDNGLDPATAMAETSLWYGRVSTAVKRDPEEFAEQAKGFTWRVASKYGEQAQELHSTLMKHIATMYQKEAASGLDQIQQTVDPNNRPKTTPLPTEVFDNFADEIAPINQGVSGTETSYRAPLIQEYQNNNGVGPVEAPVEHNSGPASVGVSYAHRIDDFSKDAASSLDQIQQIIDANNQPKVTPLPTEVAFPWEIDDTEDKPYHPKVEEPLKYATQHTADMFGGSDDYPNQVALPNVANTPDTTPNESAGAAEGRADALAGKAPTFSDAGAPQQNVRDYSKAYAETRVPHEKEYVPSLDGPDRSRTSSLFVQASSREDADFKKGYGYARQWVSGMPIVAGGSVNFEAGLFAGFADVPYQYEEFRKQSATLAPRHASIAQRMTVHEKYAQHLAENGIQTVAATTTDLDTTAPGVSPSPTGDTFINGPGKDAPLYNVDGDPAAPAGAAPYNGAEPFGHSVVPGTPGGVAERTLLFRRTVQSNLLPKETE